MAGYDPSAADLLRQAMMHRQVTAPFYPYTIAQPGHMNCWIGARRLAGLAVSMEILAEIISHHPASHVEISTYFAPPISDPIHNLPIPSVTQTFLEIALQPQYSAHPWPRTPRHHHVVFALLSPFNLVLTFAIPEVGLKTKIMTT
jgi:hypothetical protein